MTDEDSFQTALDANPDDWQTRLVFADWLQERGDPRAEGYRAMGSLRRVPKKIDGGWHFGWNEDDVWVKNLPKESSSFKEQMADTLPRCWIALIREAKAGHLFFLKKNTRREVEDVVASAFAELSAERRTAFLALPPPGHKPTRTKPKAARKRPTAPKPKRKKP